MIDEKTRNEIAQATAQVTRLVGLIGHPVEHSLSPAMQNAAFRAAGLDFRYVLLPAAPEELPRVVGESVEQGFIGWNVTIPHKERMLEYLDEMSEEVRATGACNTVRVDGGKLAGFNTDATGFMRALEEAGGIAKGAKAVLLGAGGACRAVAWALARAEHPVLILARRREQAASVARSLRPYVSARIEHGSLDSMTLEGALKSADLLVNCTPVGQWPHGDGIPLPAVAPSFASSGAQRAPGAGQALWAVRLPSHLLVYDLVYKPRPTRLLREADRAGCRTQDGLAMLVHQGAAAFELWTGQVAPVEAMWEAVRNT